MSDRLTKILFSFFYEQKIETAARLNTIVANLFILSNLSTKTPINALMQQFN